MAASFVGLSSVVLPASGATRTETFDSAPASWVGLNLTEQGNNFGFSATTNTLPTATAGEGGGTFTRSNTRGYYADPNVGQLTQADVIHSEGELFVGNTSTADTDHFMGHFQKQLADDQFGNFSMLGLGIFEGEGNVGFRFAAQIYTDLPNFADLHGDRMQVAAGAYKYTYDWNPATTTLTAKLFTTAGSLVKTSEITAPTAAFTIDSFGLNSGINSSVDTAKFFQVYIDAVQYTIASPSVLGDANLDGHVNTLDFNALALHFN
jgi:hypothetical protein